MTDYLEQKYREITARAQELAPLVDEYRRLQAAAQALATVGEAPAAASSAAAGTPARGRSTAIRKRNRRSTSRARGAGRAEQTFSLVQRQPGITIAELAKAMGIQKSYLYRILPVLQSDGKVKRVENGWYPAGS